jgi:hypothetical protein
MSKSGNNERKDALLGEPHGTANSRLRKMLLFRYVQFAEHDACYRCGFKIERVEDFSIEHKESWQKAANPRAAFFDLTGVLFSHLRCNVAAAEGDHAPRQEHGLKAYQRGCRCEECRTAKSVLDPRRPNALRTRSSRRRAPAS